MAELQMNDDSLDDRYGEFLKCFSSNREKMFAYIYSLLPNHNDAEDVFQRCSLLLWKEFSEYDASRNFLTWSYGIAHLEVRAFLRTERRDRMQFNSDLVKQLAERRLENLQDGVDLLPALQGCVSSLRSAEVELVRVVYEKKQSLKEFAKATGKSLQTLYNRLAQIRRMLFECMQRKLLSGEQK